METFGTFKHRTAAGRFALPAGLIALVVRRFEGTPSNRRNGPAAQPPGLRPTFLRSDGREPREVGEPVAGVLLPGETGFGGLAFEARPGSEVGVAEELADYEATGGL